MSYPYLVSQNELLEYIQNCQRDVVKRTEINAEMKKRYPDDNPANLRRKITNRLKSLVSWKEVEQIKKPRLSQQKYSRGELFYRIVKNPSYNR